jgi:carbamoyl-phosphate synthase large subunit
VSRSPAAPTKGGRLAGVRKIMILGTGPIVIEQACEFD